MTAHRYPKPKNERGVALLIAIFALLLISGVAISMIVMSGTESALNANYKRNVSAFYAAQAGIEEARERLVPCAPDSLWLLAPNTPTVCEDPTKATHPMFTLTPATVVGQVLYLQNPAANDPIGVDPTSTANPYYDFQYAMEFGSNVGQSGAMRIGSSQMMKGTLAGLPPMNYKWIRINLKSEAMGGIDLDGTNKAEDTTQPVRAQGNDNQCLPSQPNCTSNPNVPVTTAPVFRITAMAVDPSGSERVVQAEMAMPPTFNPNGAISSEASVDIQGNFNAFGSYPPIVTGTAAAGCKSVPTCGKFDGSKVVPDCSQKYDQATDTCNGIPRSHKDFCGQGDAVNAVSSAGKISSGPSYSQVPDTSSGCDTGGTGCISTVSPNSALAPNSPNWPYDMDEIIDLYRGISEPIEQVANPSSSLSCTGYDSNGNRTCKGEGTGLGTLPVPWPVPAGTTPDPSKYTSKITFAETGPGGKLQLTAGASGSGVLVVEGDLEILAGFQWYGLIVVRGTVDFLGGGSAPTNIVGGIIAGKSVTNATSTTDVGGSVNITYSSCAFRKFSAEQPLRVLGFREISRPRPVIP